MGNIVSILFSGEAGQGLETLEGMLLESFVQSGYFVFSSKELMSRVRGGNNTTLIRVSDEKIDSFVDQIDILFALSKNALYRVQKRISASTFIVSDKDDIGEDDQDIPGNIKRLSINSISEETGGAIYKNSVVLGLISGIFNLDSTIMEKIIKKSFEKKKEEIVKKNLLAFDAGYKLHSEIDMPIKIERSKNIDDKYLLSGTEAIGIGAIAGGCNFISAYPMSPGTGVIQYLASKSSDFGIVVEQAEDEIAAVNMMIGAWYAGARAMTTTSGGGFALMGEGLSLAGCTETPAVIHLGQRPGPATGLPTRTEQGDINLALYSGHGEFPRIILAPGSPEEGVELMWKAFNLADKYQVPVIVLTDQFYLTSTSNIKEIDFSVYKNESYIVETDENYKRYALNDDGISPRGVPGFGKGFVCADSDEHDESGRITEDFETRKNMVDKRNIKIKKIKEDAISPEIYGDPDYNILVIGWGSSLGTIRAAISEIDGIKIAFAHYRQIYPIHSDTEKILNKADKRIVIENNATGQFASMIFSQTGVSCEQKILKYNGMPFSKEEIIEQIKGGL